jgi:hypothetical protein
MKALLGRPSVTRSQLEMPQVKSHAQPVHKKALPVARTHYHIMQQRS